MIKTKTKKLSILSLYMYLRTFFAKNQVSNATFHLDKRSFKLTNGEMEDLSKTFSATYQ